MVSHLAEIKAEVMCCMLTTADTLNHQDPLLQRHGSQLRQQVCGADDTGRSLWRIVCRTKDTERSLEQLRGSLRPPPTPPPTKAGMVAVLARQSVYMIRRKSSLCDDGLDGGS